MSDIDINTLLLGILKNFDKWKELYKSGGPEEIEYSGLTISVLDVEKEIESLPPNVRPLFKSIYIDLEKPENNADSRAFIRECKQKYLKNMANNLMSGQSNSFVKNNALLKAFKNNIPPQHISTVFNMKKEDVIKCAKGYMLDAYVSRWEGSK